ncbi:hypothetical protein cypCar_00011607 [Cyprinus carpio]|nr:hypothetical protein cypCar_00011607 [Cyprinus carpio]
MESSKVVSTDKPTVFIEVNPKVKASLGMNVISAMTAATAITVMGIEILFFLMPYQSSISVRLLNFIISIFISGFACKATSNTDSTVVNVALNQVNDF